MQDVSDNNSSIRLEGGFEAFTPSELFNYFTEPNLLVQWWPREAEVDAKVGGHYRFSWPDQGWHLSGEYTVFAPGEALSFTWNWDHERGVREPMQVSLTIEPTAPGAKLIVEQKSWDDSPEAQNDRQAVIEGWIHFGMRLAGLKSGEAS